MKFQVTFKTPDAVRDTLKREAEHLDASDPDVEDKLFRFASRWVTWGEQITVEFDTDKETATVLRH